VTSGVEATPAPTAFALRANEPNPFNAGTTIRYDVPAGGGRVDLAIYDARGSLVRRLLGGEEPAGRRQLRWDGRDDNGRTLATGVYFCRMSTPAGVHTRKMSLVQ
jgi:flagellar hook assembly protein FlgD